MVQRTIARLYDDYDDAAAVVSHLESAGIPHSEISIVSRDRQERGATADSTTDTARTGTSESSDSGAAAGTGATIGTVLGGGAGLLAGIGALAIPGVGPVVAAGWLIATLTGAGVGAAAGGLVGGLTGAGVSPEEAGVYNEGVRRGGTLVTVRADEADVSRIESIMGERKAVDWRARDTEMRASGWNGRSDDTDTLPASEGLGTRGTADPTLAGSRNTAGGEYRTGQTGVSEPAGDMRGFASGEGRYGGGGGTPRS